MSSLNLVVVICHDLGQHLGCYGRSEVRSPNIDALAASGIRFQRSFCTAPQCSPSRAALWTGRYPHATGVVGLTHGGFVNDLNPGERHLAQILRETGYETHLFGGQHEARNPERCGHEFRHSQWQCRGVSDEFAAFLAERRVAGRPFFAQIGFFEPHRPFPHEDVTPLSRDLMNVPPYLPDIPVVREDLADLEASVASVDRAVGRVIEAVRASPEADRTLIVFTADHGIAFVRAKMTLYDPGIEVALVMAGAGTPAGIVRDELISNVDVMPTLLDMTGIAIPANLHGRSFAALLHGGAYTPNEFVFAEKTYHTYYDPMRAVRNDRWKLIANFENAPWQETSTDYRCNAKSYVESCLVLEPPGKGHYHPPVELYDLQEDPWEQRNLADDPGRREIRQQLTRVLHNWMRRTGDPLLDGPMPQRAYIERMKAFKQEAAASDPDSARSAVGASTGA